MAMSKIIKTLSLLLILLIICETQGVSHKPEPDCVTPDDALGACVDVRYCVTIMTAIINKDHITNPDVAKFLRESQCGIERGSQKVCCQMSSIDFGETPAITAHPKTTVIPVTPTTPKLTPSTYTPVPNLPPIQPPPLIPTPSHQQQPVKSDIEDCGKLEQHEAPLKWIAELWYKYNKLGRNIYESKCLGTIISLKHVIVPAHCVSSLPEHVSLDHLTIRDEDYRADKIFIHASYNQPKFANDVAIIELDVELSINQKARGLQQINNAICLDGSQSLSHQQDKSNVVFMKAEYSPLRRAQITLIPKSQCSIFFDQQFTNLTSSQFCANIQSNQTDISPFIGAIIMIYDSSKQQYTLKGFTSAIVRTEQSFDESKPFVFTDVAHYKNWIRTALDGSNTQSNEISNKPHDDSDDNGSGIHDRTVLDTLKECRLRGETGRCVIEDYCTIYQSSDAQRKPDDLEFLRSIKCSTGSNSFQEDGVCCPDKYVNLSTLAVYDFDVRFKTKEGAELLDMEKCGMVDSSRRIVGGRLADLKEFPWYALIKYKVGDSDKFMCGGSVISSRYVLTCAHCITQTPYNVIGVRLGEFDLTTDPDCRLTVDDVTVCNPLVQDIDIEQLIPHPQYNNPRFSNDVGLVRMAKNVEFMKGGIIPICLPINKEMLQTLSNYSTVAGFGLTEHGRDSNVLLKIVVPKVQKEACQSFHRSSIQLSEGHACYGGEGIVDSCKGDSGSPLLNYVVIDSKLRAIQIGIVASGHGDCGRGVMDSPGIYTNVSKYLQWILGNMYEF